MFLLCALTESSQGLRSLSSSSYQEGGAAAVFVAELSLSGQAHAAWQVSMQAASVDRQFWSSEWRDLEVTLLQLQAGADQALATGPGGTQATLRAKGTAAKLAPAFKVAFNTTASKKEAKGKSPVAELKISSNPKSVADLMPALGMLKSLYEEGKQRIARINAKETQSKQHFQGQQREHLLRLATVEAKFKGRFGSEEVRANLTRDENWMFNYWAKVRERQHRLFHTSLKIQHGTMEKEKMMIDAYEKTIASTSNKAMVQKELAKVSGEPEVALLQAAWRTTAQYFSDALHDVRTTEDELRKEPPLV